MSKQRKRKLFFTALAFMLPFLILYTVFTIWPVIQGFYVSMHKWGLMGKQKYIGFDNYIKFAGDKKFWSALGNTCKFVVITAPMLVIIALILALLANRQTVMKKGLRISYYLPSILSVSVASFIAKNTFSPYTGLLNGVLHQLHILPANTELQFLLDPKLVWVTISVMTVWWTIGFTMMLYISALQDIDMGIYEAASIDGATSTQRPSFFSEYFFFQLFFLDPADDRPSEAVSVFFSSGTVSKKQRSFCKMQSTIAVTAVRLFFKGHRFCKRLSVIFAHSNDERRSSSCEKFFVDLSSIVDRYRIPDRIDVLIPSSFHTQRT